MKSVEVVAYSRADELAYLSLADAMEITKGINARVVGGHMVALLKAVFPVPGSSARYTRDSDVAIETAVASSGAVHDALTSRGYVATAGNHYEKDSGGILPLEIDLLVPSPGSRFVPQRLGGRSFDSAPGVRLALAQDPIDVRVKVTLRDGRKLNVVARLPGVETAVIVKAITYEQRRKLSDLEDLIGLLEIAAHYKRAAIGGWELGAEGASATRAQAIAVLNQLARNVRSLPSVPGIERLTPLVAGLIARS